MNGLFRSSSQNNPCTVFSSFNISHLFHLTSFEIIIIIFLHGSNILESLLPLASVSLAESLSSSEQVTVSENRAVLVRTEHFSRVLLVRTEQFSYKRKAFPCPIFPPIVSVLDKSPTRHIQKRLHHSALKPFSSPINQEFNFPSIPS